MSLEKAIGIWNGTINLRARSNAVQIYVKDADLVIWFGSCPSLPMIPLSMTHQ